MGPLLGGAAAKPEGMNLLPPTYLERSGPRLTEAVALDGGEGGMLAAAVFVVGVSVSQGAMSAIPGQPFPGTQVVLWSLVVVVSAGILSAFDRILVGPQAQASRPEISPATEPRPQPAVRLTAREQQVLELVAEGYSNTMIATRLHLSESTIKTYMQTRLTRFNAPTRA